MNLKEAIRRRRVGAPTIAALESVLREFLYRAGEPSERRPITPFDFHPAATPRSQLDNVALRLLIVRYNKIVRFIDPELAIDWPPVGIPIAAGDADWALAERITAYSSGWTPKRVQRALDCVERALILHGPADIPSKF